MTSGRRKGLKTHLKRIAAKGIAAELAVQTPAESVLGGKTAFKGKYRLFLGNKSRILAEICQNFLKKTIISANLALNSFILSAFGLRLG